MASQSSSSSISHPSDTSPTCAIIIGMAGSGKSTLMQRLNAHVHQHKIPSYIMNLDPAVKTVNYEPNIDIRDTVNYKEVMSQYKLGPNGGIITSLNLFATRFNQVMDFIDKRNEEGNLKHIFVDTPGQIEVFTWSASGQIITESLASAVPTVVVYVVDTPRTTSPITFMSNMMYATSILYKTKLPFIVCFNKIDVADHSFAEEWMQDLEAFEVALQSEKSYMATLSRSMSLVLEEFYKNLTTVGVSAVTGAGMDDFFAALDKGRQEYFESYLPMREAIQKKMAEQQAQQRAQHLEEVQAMIQQDQGKKVVVGPGSQANDDASDEKVAGQDDISVPSAMTDEQRHQQAQVGRLKVN